MTRRSGWLVVLTVLGASVPVLVWRASRETRMPVAAPPATDPRLAFDTPYRNVHPDVQYVGDAACAQCHEQIARSYASHPMGQSLAPATSEPPQRLTERFGNPFHDPSGEYRYRVEQRDGELWHHEERVTPDGEVLFVTSHPAAYAVGSGQHGRSYLIDRDGWLFLSPITWYPQKETWALSPGYEKRNQHFTRPIVTECLFCHTNFAAHVKETTNRYQRPIFHGYAIGCERCHGPGQLHVARHERGEPVAEKLDETIVNPAGLTPPLRDAVCQQCHLGGEVRFARHGRDLYDYRPGLPWHEFAAVYVRGPHLRQGEKITGHVEQMHESRCWQASGGRLGCTSCHDPHTSPPAQERAAFYRQRCLACHESAGCTEDASLRAATQPADHCVACHMPPIDTEVQHAAITNHRVPRRAAQDPDHVEPTGLPLVHFHRDLVDSHDPESLRDLGVALVRLGDEQAAFVTPEDRRTAVSLLEAAVQRHPDDWEAVEALAHAVAAHGQPARALELFERVLASRPQREFSLYSAASRAQQLKRYDVAVAYWRPTIEVNPWLQRAHQSLALALGEQRAWAQAEAAARRALELFPGDGRSRQLLVECLLGSREFQQADAEFQTLLRLEPQREGPLRRWYVNHPGRRAFP